LKRAHTELEAWREGIALVKAMYEATKGFPAEERYGLTSQIRRAAVSIPANIAEGAARGTKKEFLQFLIIARGSISELETLLTIAEEVGFLSNEKAGDLDRSCDQVSSRLSGLITSVRKSGPT
jgi:four helix bundle protein